MKAVKGNKEYTIDESQAKVYKDAGFDLYDAEGKQVAWGRGRTVPYEAHMRAVEEIEKLQELAAEYHAENEALKQEVKALKGKSDVQKSGDLSTGRKQKEVKEGG